MRIGIVGHGITIERENYDWAIEDTVFYTVRKTLESIGMSIDQIETVVQAGDDVADGLAIQHVQTVEAAGAYLKEESKVERDGAWAVYYAMIRMMTGKFKTALVTGCSKGTQCGLSAFSGMCADPFYLRPVGADSDTIAAIQAGYFSNRSGATERDFAEVARKNRKAGLKNPRIMQGEGGDYSIEDILNAPKISTPINELNTGRTGDGCVAVILATEDYIKEHKLSATYITGVGQISDAYYPTYRNFSRLLGAEKAAQSAYKMAGITPDKIQLAEVHESYAHQELMVYEALGFCKEGEATKLLKDGTTNRDGKLPVNPSGGVTCGNIIYGSGLARVMEASLQVQGKAGDVQVKGVKTAVAHAQAGLGMQANLVMVLEA